MLRCVNTDLCQCKANSCHLSRIVPITSQILTVYYGKQPVNITLDSGATVSFISKTICENLNFDVLPNGQIAKLGDGCTLLASKGEIDVILSRNKWNVRLRAIVVEKLSSEIYGGMTFLTENDIQTRPATGEIKVLGKYVIYQTNPTMNPPQLKSVDMLHSTAVLRQKVLFPKTMAIAKQPSTEKNRDFPNDSSISVSLPSSLSNDQFVLVGPRIENCNKDWPPENIVRIEDGSVNIENKTKYPITLGKDVKIIDLKKVAIEDYDHTFAKTNNIHNDQISPNTHDSFSNLEEIAIKNASEIDVSRAPLKLQQKLKDAHLLYADVFAPDLSTGYNGFSGQHLVRLQFADENRPRMSKCHVPSWCGKNDDVKQKKMDDLEKQGVLLDPYKENVQIKLISPSFLRTKARVKGKELNECDISDIRWIISPCQLNPYLRQLHTNNTSKEDLFIFKSEKPHCIEFDLFEGYFQNHISRKDWGYLAVETPYKGLRVLTRSGQGLLNQEIEMAQLLTKVLGSEIQK